MTKFLNKISVPLISLIFLLNMSSAGMADTTVSAEVGALNLSKADAERTFDTITNTILDALKGDDSVKIAGFGTYKVAKRKARVGRNPRTGEQIQIAASQKVKFLPAKALKEVFNK